MQSIAVRIPWPPSANTMWRRAGHRIYLSPQGRKFREEVYADLTRQLVSYETLTCRLAVSLELTPPNHRKWDIDNRIKSAVDSLMHAGLIADDEQIDMLVVKRLPIEAPGACDVVITELERKAEA